MCDGGNNRAAENCLHEFFFIRHFAFLIFAHLARCAAAILRRADGGIVRLRGVELGAIGTTFCRTLILAQRALCAAAIFARDFADTRRLRVGFSLPPYTLAKAVSAAFSADKCRSTRSRSFFNCFTIPDSFAIDR
jgi:hypothetical protein